MWPCLTTQKVSTLPLKGESRGRVFSAPAGICCQQLRQRRGLGPGRPASVCGLEVQETVTERLQGADATFDAGKGLCQLLFQECIDRLVVMLKVGGGEGLKLFEGQSQGAQPLDYLHTPERFFPKQAVVALAAAQGVEEAEVLIVAQDFDRHTAASRELSNSHRL